jgi:hypothetical protein
LTKCPYQNICGEELFRQDASIKDASIQMPAGDKISVDEMPAYKMRVYKMP